MHEVHSAASTPPASMRRAAGIRQSDAGDSCLVTQRLSREFMEAMSNRFRHRLNRAPDVTNVGGSVMSLACAEVHMRPGDQELSRRVATVPAFAIAATSDASAYSTWSADKPR